MKTFLTEMKSRKCSVKEKKKEREKENKARRRESKKGESEKAVSLLKGFKVLLIPDQKIILVLILLMSFQLI